MAHRVQIPAVLARPGQTRCVYKSRDCPQIYRYKSPSFADTHTISCCLLSIICNDARSSLSSRKMTGLPMTLTAALAHLTKRNCRHRDGPWTVAAILTMPFARTTLVPMDVSASRVPIGTAINAAINTSTELMSTLYRESKQQEQQIKKNHPGFSGVTPTPM